MKSCFLFDRVEFFSIYFRWIFIISVSFLAKRLGTCSTNPTSDTTQTFWTNISRFLEDFFDGLESILYTIEFHCRPGMRLFCSTYRYRLERFMCRPFVRGQRTRREPSECRRRTKHYYNRNDRLCGVYSKGFWTPMKRGFVLIE